MRLVVYGAGGFSREVSDLALDCGHVVAGFVDDQLSGTHLTTGLPVVGSISDLAFDAVVLAIGHTEYRETVFQRISPIARFISLVHPSAYVSSSATLGVGSLIMQNVVVNANAHVGANVILNVGCCVAHDAVVGEHSHLAPGVQVAGEASVGCRCFCGVASVVLPRLRVGDACTVGAGAVVTRDVPQGLTVVGVPAHPIG